MKTSLLALTLAAAVLGTAASAGRLDFAATDTNGDGLIQPAELSAQLADAFRSSGTSPREGYTIESYAEARAQEEITDLDRNGDGVLQPEEVNAPQGEEAAPAP